MIADTAWRFSKDGQRMEAALLWRRNLAIANKDDQTLAAVTKPLNDPAVHRE